MNQVLPYKFTNHHFLVESTEIYASLILHIKNPFKNKLIEVFLSQVDEYDGDK